MLKRLEDRLAIEELNAAFAAHLDHNRIDELVALFSNDALYISGERQARGLDELRRYFEARQTNGPRTSRHFYSGLRISLESETQASGTSVCLSFAQNGLPPLPIEPFMVADFEDRYIKLADGEWRIQGRHIKPIFRR